MNMAVQPTCPANWVNASSAAMQSSFISNNLLPGSGINLDAIFQSVTKQLSNGATDLLDREARGLYHKCLDLIPSTIAKYSRPLDKAYVASQMRSAVCLPIARSAMKDRFVAEVVLPVTDYMTYGGNREFAYFGDKYSKGKGLNEVELANAIVTGATRSNQQVNEVSTLMHPVESLVDQAGKYISENIHDGLGQVVRQFPFSS